MSSVPATGITKGGRGSSRWTPTVEQVMLLEGMYRGGLKTPSATQMEQITARLSVHGKIEGKNVFYWFQNHKARERQKLRKKLMYHQLRLPAAAAAAHDQPFLPPHQVGGVEDASSSWKKVDLPSHDQICNNLMCDCPLVTMMMMDTTPYCTRVPLTTLQLFPVKPDLKGDDHSSNNS